MQVQTEDQYIFIYDAILEAVICGNSEIPVDKLQAHVEMLTTPLPGENFRGIDVEFKVQIQNMQHQWCILKWKLLTLLAHIFKYIL